MIKDEKVAGKALQKVMTNVLILDASGSMDGRIAEVRNSIDTLITAIKEASKDYPELTYRTKIIKFSSRGNIVTLLDTARLEDLTDNVRNLYRCNGMTALYDTVVETFQKLQSLKGGVYINIISDGKENDSIRYGIESVREVVREGRDNNWGITFMGASEDSLSEAGRMGVPASNTKGYSHSSVGFNLAAQELANSVKNYIKHYAEGTLTKEIASNTLVEEEIQPENATIAGGKQG